MGKHGAGERGQARARASAADTCVRRGAGLEAGRARCYFEKNSGGCGG